MNFQEFKSRYIFNTNLTDEIGSGSYGMVYKARDTRENEDVAVKAMKVNLKQSQSLKAEIEIAKKIPRHSNIARYQDWYRIESDEGTFDFAIMKYYGDGNLEQFLSKEGPNVDQKKKIARGIIDGLEHIHTNNILHRDLKPSNILISKYENEVIPLITDFGMSNHNSSVKANDGFIGGTIEYSAPEQLMGKISSKDDGKLWVVDLWSLGIILYEIFTNRHPFAEAINNENPTVANYYAYLESNNNALDLSDVPEPYETIIKKCLVFNAEFRIKSIKDVIALFSNNFSNDAKLTKERTKGSFTYGDSLVEADRMFEEENFQGAQKEYESLLGIKQEDREYLIKQIQKCKEPTLKKPPTINNKKYAIIGMAILFAAVGGYFIFGSVDDTSKKPDPIEEPISGSDNSDVQLISKNFAEIINEIFQVPKADIEKRKLILEQNKDQLESLTSNELKILEDQILITDGIYMYLSMRIAQKSQVKIISSKVDNGSISILKTGVE